MRKLENNWQQKSLENLEKDMWGEPTYDSYLVRRTHEIRRLPLNELTLDDIAMMLRQQFSLDHMVPLAIDKLQLDILAHGEADSDGAIMEAVLKIPGSFWASNKDYWTTIKKLLDENQGVWTLKKLDSFYAANPN